MQKIQTIFLKRYFATRYRFSFPFYPHLAYIWFIFISFIHFRFGGGIFFDILNAMCLLIYLVSMDYLFLKQWLSLDPFSILYVNLKVERKKGIDNQTLLWTQYKILNKAKRRYGRAKQCTGSLKYCSYNFE